MSLECSRASLSSSGTAMDDLLLLEYVIRNPSQGIHSRECLVCRRYPPAVRNAEKLRTGLSRGIEVRRLITYVNDVRRSQSQFLRSRAQGEPLRQTIGMIHRETAFGMEEQQILSQRRLDIGNHVRGDEPQRQARVVQRSQHFVRAGKWSGRIPLHEFLPILRVGSLRRILGKPHGTKKNLHRANASPPAHHFLELHRSRDSQTQSELAALVFRDT